MTSRRIPGSSGARPPASALLLAAVLAGSLGSIYAETVGLNWRGSGSAITDAGGAFSAPLASWTNLSGTSGVQEIKVGDGKLSVTWNAAGLWLASASFPGFSAGEQQVLSGNVYGSGGIPISVTVSGLASIASGPCSLRLLASGDSLDPFQPAVVDGSATNPFTIAATNGGGYAGMTGVIPITTDAFSLTIAPDNYPGTPRLRGFLSGLTLTFTPRTNAAFVEHITDLAIASGSRQVTLTWTSNSNTLYVVEQAASLPPPGWQPQLTNLLAQGSNTSASLPQPATNAQSFYRVARDVAGTRYYQALESAAVQQTTLASVTDNSLLLGNGDLNGLLYASGRSLRLRLTKNDVWDARIDTSQDQPLIRINITNHTYTGGAPYFSVDHSYNLPYPCPLTCAVLSIGDPSQPAWQRIRAQGASQLWTAVGGEAVMAITGAAGASCGWAADVPSGVFTNLHLRLGGSTNAKFYVEVISAAGGYLAYTAGWQNAPQTLQDYDFGFPAHTAAKINLYAWTTDGALATNRYALIALEGPAGSQYAYDLNDLSTPAVASTLDVRRAVARVGGTANMPSATVRALARQNVFLIEASAAVSLLPTTATFVPAPTRGTNNGVEYLLQTLPADPSFPTNGDWPGMSFVVAKAVQGSRAALSVVTSLESSNVLADAVALAQSTLAADADTLVQAHEEAWQQFWSASRIWLSDAYLSSVWYRNLYFMRCISRPGTQPVGLFAGMVTDSAAWHGDFHLNYNSEQTYWAWYSCNHAELAEPYERFILHYLPRAKWMAQQTYGCGGAFFPLTLFLHEPPDPATCQSRNGRQVVFMPWTYTLGDSGWAIQNHWLHYKHYPDAGLLATNVYPLLKEVAQFYADFADRCDTNAATGRINLGPSYSPEHWNWGSNNVTCDIAFGRLAFKAAIEAAQTLGVDGSLVPRWQAALDQLPDYPRTSGASPVIVDVEGVGPIQYNVPVPALPVYPADDVHWFSSAAERNIFSNTVAGLSWNGNNGLIILGGARARLGVAGTITWLNTQLTSRQRPNGTLTLDVLGAGFNDNGHYTEQFAATGVITELLLQSVSDILRIFPAWPASQEGGFENLRAQGGFLVSAEQAGGQVRFVKVRSTVGGRLKFVNPWPTAPQARRNGMTTSLTEEGERVFSGSTTAGDLIELSPQP